MKTPIDIETWKRKEHFEFFNSFDDPFFSIVTQVDITQAYERIKARQASLFRFYLYCSLKAVNLTDAFKYRILNGQVYSFDPIHASPTIDRGDETFGLAFMNYFPDFKTFSKEAGKEINAVKQSKGLRLTEENKRPDVIHYSVLPWVHFTDLSHPRNFNAGESIPKITFGRFKTNEGKVSLPVSIHAHHGLMDGYHAGKFLDTFQNLLNSAQIYV